METLGQNLKKYRILKAVSRCRLSQESGVSRSYITELELDKYKNVSIDILCKLCKGLSVTPNDLIPEHYWRK